MSKHKINVLGYAKYLGIMEERKAVLDFLRLGTQGDGPEDEVAREYRFLVNDIQNERHRGLL